MHTNSKGVLDLYLLRSVEPTFPSLYQARRPTSQVSASKEVLAIHEPLSKRSETLQTQQAEKYLDPELVFPTESASCNLYRAITGHQVREIKGDDYIPLIQESARVPEGTRIILKHRIRILLKHRRIRIILKHKRPG